MATQIVVPDSASSPVQRFTRDLPHSWNRLENEVVTWGEAALRQAKEQASAQGWRTMIGRIQKYLHGDQWPSRATAYGNSRPVTNRMFRQYWELVSLLTEGKPEPEIKVYDGRNDYSELQVMIESLLEFWAGHPRYHDALQDIIGMGLLVRAVGKVQWNPYLAGGMGDTELIFIDPRNFYKLGEAEDGTCECMIEQRKVSLAALVRRYGEVAKSVKIDPDREGNSLKPMRPGSLSNDQWSKFSPQIQSILGVQGVAGRTDNLYPSVTETLFWLRDPAKNETSQTRRIGPEHANWSYMVEPGMSLYPRGRIFSVAGGRVMSDTCNPYFHNVGPGPYTEFLPLRTPDSGSMSITGNLIGGQDVLNRILAGMLETIKAGLIPTVVAPRDALSRADRDNLSLISGGTVEYNPVAGQPPKFREQPQVPALAQWFTQFTTNEMDRTTGSSALDAASQKDQIPSHDTMEMIQNSRSGMVRLMGRRLENFMNVSGQMVISNMLQFYTLGHRLAILGNKGMSAMDFVPNYGSLLPRGIMPEEFVRRVRFSVRTGSALSFDRETRAQLAVVLARGGFLSRKNMLRALNAAGASINIDQNDKELAVEALQKLALASLAGQAAGHKEKK